jgi:putative beta-barrel porin BBP2
VLLHVPPEVAVDVRRDARGLLLVFRSGSPEELAPTNVAKAAPPPAPVAASAPLPPTQPPPVPAPVVISPKPEAAPARPAPLAAAPAPVTPVPAQATSPAPTPAGAQSGPTTAELAKRLFPTGPSEGQAQTGSVAELYPQLFPSGVAATQPESERAVDVTELGPDEGAVLGPFRVRAAVDARYVDADTFIESSAEPTRDNYLEVQPRVLAAAPVGAGVLRLEYSPVFRAFATYDQVNSSSHLVGAGLELPVGARVTLRARDRFQSGVLDTRAVDPGGEYFFGLGHFNRNDVDAGASIMVGPRLSVELAGAAGTVHFTEPSSFFDYDTRNASAGLGFELTPRLRAIADYVYDRVPTNDERPEAESTAHGARLSLNGELLPLLTGELSVGYRQQDSPNAGAGGTRYSGLTMRAALMRELGRDSTFAVYANRSTPVSAYQENAFYVSTGVQGVLTLALAAKFEARGGLGYQWNDYRTIAPEIGEPREDRILGWFVGLRRPIARKLALSAAYRDEDRNSNVDDLDTDARGFYLTLEWDLFGTPPR